MATKKKPEGAKPGWKTTEFWVTIACAVIGTGLSAWGANSGNDALVEVGVMLTGGASGLYAISRGVAKKNTHGS